MQPVAPVNGCNQGSLQGSLQGSHKRLAASLQLAKRGHALYVGCSEHFELADVVRRDQNVSHLIVFGPKDASLLAR
jgi:hypothetical protein